MARSFRPKFFEFGTLAALRIFQTEKVDVVLLEVGLGGRQMRPTWLITMYRLLLGLAIDHVDWLGDDINVIGFEKAGIFRSGKPAICGQPKPPSTVAAHADDIGRISIRLVSSLIMKKSARFGSGEVGL